MISISKWLDTTTDLVMTSSQAGDILISTIPPTQFVTVRVATPTLYMRRLLGNKAGVILTAFMELESVIRARGDCA